MEKCGIANLSLWELLFNSIKLNTNGCKGLNLITVPFGNCSLGCDWDIADEDLIKYLFTVDSDGIVGIRIMEFPTATPVSDCNTSFISGISVLRPVIGLGADNLPALIITKSTL